LGAWKSPEAQVSEGGSCWCRIIGGPEVGAKAGGRQQLPAEKFFEVEIVEDAN
jgi:hypothetical protein